MYMNLNNYNKMKLYIKSKKDKELTAQELLRLLSITMKYSEELKSLGIEPITTFKFEK